FRKRTPITIEDRKKKLRSRSLRPQKILTRSTEARSLLYPQANAFATKREEKRTRGRVEDTRPLADHVQRLFFPTAYLGICEARLHCWGSCATQSLLHLYQQR
ncbi:hypothetical protein P5V15_004544, partial [Pogonomyrmex californicus]